LGQASGEGFCFMEHITKYTTIIMSIILFLLVIDLMGFYAWALSGQTPIDDYHLGIITETIVKIIRG
jgi:hypothetical protein